MCIRDRCCILGAIVSTRCALQGAVAVWALSCACLLYTSVETLCKRIILIDDGTLRYDGKLDALATKLSPYKILKVQVRDGETTWERFGDIVEASEGVVSLRVHRERVPAITAQLLAELPIVDLSVVDPPLEHVIDRVYREGLI